MRRAVAVAAAVALAALAGCGPGSPGGRDGGPVEPPPAIGPQTAATTTSTAGPPATATTAAPPTPPPAGTAGCAPVPPRAAPAADRPVYRVSVDVDAAARTAAGTSTVRFTPDLAVERIVLRLWPANPKVVAAGGGMDLSGPVLVDGAEVEAQRPEPTTVVVPRAVAAGQAVTVTTSWRIRLPAGLSERWSVAGGAVRLGSFVPLLPWEPGRGWAVDPPTRVNGEATTSPVADFDLTVTAGGLDVVATGTAAGPGRWRAEAVRDVAIAAGRFRRVERVVPGAGPGGSPVTVAVVVDAAVAIDPAPYLDKAASSLASFATRFGEYPWGSYTLAITEGLRGGIENPTLTFQGPGTNARTTSHEVAHMWFYALVGNNQWRDPWLDEGLASYAEAVFEGTIASFRSRPVPAGARGRLGEPLSFWDDRPGDYYRGVYVQGAQAVASLGPPRQVDCALARYVALHAHTVATPDDLKRVLRSTFPDAEATLARYGT